MSEVTAAALDPAAARKAARNATALAIASIVGKGAFFLWQIMLSRLLTQSEYGIYGTIAGMVLIAGTLPEFGMGIIVLRDVARHRDLAGKMLSATLVMQPALGVVAYAGLILAGLLLGYDESIRGLLPLAGLTLFVNLLGTMVYNQLLAREQMMLPAVVSVVHILVLITLVAAALLGGLGLAGLYWATIAAGSLRALVFWLALIQDGIRTVWPLDRAVVWGLLINGAPIALIGFLGTAYQHVDKIITTATIGEEGTALLLLAFILVEGMIELLSTTVLVAVFPMMSRQYGEGMLEAFDFLVSKLAYLTLVLMIPVGVTITFLAPAVVGLLFDARYAGVAQILAVLIWYGVIRMVANVFGQVLLIQNRQRRLAVIRAAGLALNIALLVTLLPRMGPVGAAVSSVIAEFVTTLVLVLQWEQVGEYCRRMRVRMLRLLLAGIGMALAVLLLRDLSPAASPAWQQLLPILTLVMGGVVYVGLAGLLGVIAPDDRGFIRQVLISMPGGSLVARVWR